MKAKLTSKKNARMVLPPMLGYLYLLICCLASVRLYAQPPAPTITGATGICTGATTALTANGQAGATFQWWSAPTGGTLLSTNASYTPPAQGTAGTYHWYVEQTVGGLNSTRTDVTVTVSQPPAVTILPANPSVPCPGSSILLTASGATTYTWSPGGATGNTLSANPMVNTTYTATGTTNGCAASASKTVTVNRTIASADVSICQGATAHLSATGATTYIWNPGNLSGAAVNVSPAATTTYVVSGTSSGCTSTDTVVVTVYPAIGLTAGGNVTVPEGTIVNLTCSSALPATFVWTPNNGNTGTLSGNSVFVVPTQTTTYKVIATNGTGCVDTALKTVTLSKLAAVSGSTMICNGTGTTLTASGTGPFTWYDAATGGNLISTNAIFATSNLGGNNSFWVSDNGGARKEIKVMAAGAPPAATATPSMLCGSGTSRLRSPYVGLVSWYDAPVGGNLIGTTTADTSLVVTPAVTTTYYAQGQPLSFSQTFNYTGTVQTWIVPPGVTSINVDAYGARGGHNFYSKSYESKGGRVQATLNVIPGQVLYIYVGGLSSFNGGANKVNPVTTQGGDATDIRIGGTALTNRVLVAGGGGGVGPFDALGNQGIGMPGHGDGGGLNGQDGGSYGGFWGASAGIGGTQSSGGNGGTYLGIAFASKGVFGQGGQGTSYSGAVGGGGGGGWYGGGGGADNGDGGGGSSYTNPILCSNVIHTQGAWSDTGVLLISYGTSCAAPTRTPVTVTVNPVPAPVTLNGPHCSGDTLTLTTPFMPAQVQWNLGNTLFLTDAPATWDTTTWTPAAGNGTMGTGLNQLYWPRRSFADATGNVYVPDQNLNRVVKWAPGATQGTVVAGGNSFGGDPNQLFAPQAVYVDALQNVYIADYNNHRIQKWAPGATQGVTVAGGNGQGGGPAQLSLPINLTVDAGGTIYIADFGNNRIQKWTPGATQGVTVAGMNFGTLSGPTAVKLDSAGNIYVSEVSNGRVTKWVPGSDTGIVITSGLSGATDMAMDGAGNLYITDQYNYRILRWTPNTGASTTVIGSSQLNSPIGVAVDGAGNLYVTEYSARVKKFTMQNVSDTLFAAPTMAGNNTVKVTNFAGCSAIATKVIDQQAVVATEPVGKMVCNGSAVALSVTATGASGYQWQKNGANIPSATAAAYNLTSNATASNIGLYKVIAIGGNGCNDTSVNVSVMVNPMPVASLNAPTCSGDTLNLTASLIPAEIQWKSGSTVLRTDTATWNTNGNTMSSSGVSSGPAQLSSPRHSYVTAAGDLYVADAANNRVVKWASGGSGGVVVAGGNGQGANANQLNQPYAVYVDAVENVYVADFGNHRVQKWAVNATSGITVAGTGTAGTAAGQLNGPDHITMDISGNLYVTEYNNHRVTKWAQGATQGITVAGVGNGANGSGNNALNSPSAARIDSVGNIYVADAGNNRVVKWAAGSGSPVVTGFTGWASDMEIDRQGNIYLTDETNDLVQRFKPGAVSGVTIAGTGTAGNSANQLNSPAGITLDQSGNLYISDRVNNRVQKFDLNNTDLFSPSVPAGSYTATVTSFTGCAVTTPVKTVGQTALISTGPVGGTVCSGTPFTFTSTITGAIGGYQWKKNGTIIPSATTATLSLPSTADSDNAMYQVIAIGSGGCNDASANVTLKVNPTPVVSLNGTLCSGDTINLNTSFAPGLLQWKSGSTVVRTDTAYWGGGYGIGYYDVYSPLGGLVSSYSPRNIFADRDGNVYTADDYLGMVIKWDPWDNGTAVAGSYWGPGSNPNELNQPSGVYVDAAENIYVADFGNHRVQKWTKGNYYYGQTVAGIGSYPGTSASQLNGPTHVTMDTLGNLYVTEYNNNRITKWAPGATQGVTVAGDSSGTAGSGNGQLNHPRAAKIDAAGNLYIADNGNNRVMKWAPGSTAGVVVAGMGGMGSGPDQLNSPNGLEVDHMGNIYISDENNSRVQRWAPGATSGTTVVASNQLTNPAGVALDPKGTLYVSDRGNYRVEKYPLYINTHSPATAAGSYTATVTTLAGCTATTPALSINQSATIGTQPASIVDVCSSNPIVLTAAATNASNYQWQQNGTDIPTATEAVLQKVNSAITDAGTYRLIATGASGCNDTSAISTVFVNTMSNSLPSINVTDGNMHIDGLAYTYTDSSCRPIAAITDAAGGNVLGTVDASVVLDSTVQVFNGNPYVQRHFDLQPSSDGAATVQLYALQSEFDAYNTYIAAHSLSQPQLPTGPSDTAGISNISVTQFHGIPASGTTGPGGQYDASQAEQISNNMITVDWNGSYWELSFPINSFSGFFISTGSMGTPLAIGLKDITARNVGKVNIVDWNTATEDEGDYFEVERSLDAKRFSKIGTVAARYKMGGNYQFTDEHPASGINYYRLKMRNAAGNSGYSKIVSAVVKGAGLLVEAFPNPAKDAINVQTSTMPDGEATITLLDVSGRTILSVPANGKQTTVDVSGISSGVYLLRYQNGTYNQNIRFTKE